MKIWTLVWAAFPVVMTAQELPSQRIWNSAELPQALEWRPFAVRTTPWRSYERFQGYHQEIPVEGAEAVVATNDGRVDFSVVPTVAEAPQVLHFAPDADGAVWLWRGDQWIPALRTDDYRPSPLRRMRFWTDAAGRVLDSLDLIRRADTSLLGKVFHPDPLSKVNAPYGGTYVDANDGNSAVLDSLRTEVAVPLTWNGTGFLLANSAAVVQEFDPPTVAVPVLPGPRADFSRSDAEFEMVNALFHLAAWKQRLASLGYGGIVAYPIPVDVNAYGGADQSAFDFGTTPPRLYFGEGGVDDAEDSDVLVHEYGHAMAYGAAPGSNIGIQRQALEEAVCDYWAVSWSLEQGSARWADVFTWDGHNTFWSGRSALNSQQKMYPNLTFTGPYSHTSVLVDALVRGRQRVGGSVMDGLVLEALYSLTASTTFRQFAEAVLEADTLKHGGLHASGLHTDFATWQILLPGLGSDSMVPEAAPNTIWIWPGIWPEGTPEILEVVDASGRALVLRRGGDVSPGTYYTRSGTRVVVTP